MRAYLFLLVLMIFSSLSFAQREKKLITLEDLHVKGTFTPKTVRGIVSMRDGEHYTALEKGGVIAKYRYSTGEKVGVLFDVSNHGNRFRIKSLNDLVFLSIDRRRGKEYYHFTNLIPQIRSREYKQIDFMLHHSFPIDRYNFIFYDGAKWKELN